MLLIANKINYLWLDVETTGLDPVNNDIIQLAAIAVINGKEHPCHFNEFCQPFDWTTIDDEALRITHTTREQLAKEQMPVTMLSKFIDWCKSFGVKFTIAGYNADFDRSFLSNFFKKAHVEREFNDFFNADIRDLYRRAKGLKNQLNTPNLKLSTLCEHFKIPIKAHDALSDISATIKLDKLIAEMLGDVEVYDSIVEHIVDKNLCFREPAQLHLHSKFSHTDSILSIKDIVKWCLHNNVPAFSCADHCMAASLYDMVKIPDIIKSLNKKYKTDYSPDQIVGIPGVGLYVTYGGQNFYINCWAISNGGYTNLTKLASIGWSNRVDVSDIEFPLLPLEEIFKYKEGLIFGLPGINGPTPKLITEKRLAEIEHLVTFLHANVDLRLELASIDVYKYYDSAYGFMSYNIAGGNIQKSINNLYMLLANKYKIKCVPVSDAHFFDPKDKILQDCISKNSYKDHRYFFESRHALTAKEMFTVLKSHLGDLLDEEKFNLLIDNTYEIADLAAQIRIQHEYHLPRINIPDDIRAKDSDYNKQTFLYTMRKIREHGRWNDAPEYVERFKKEIDVIMKNDTLNFLPYFLVYEDICSFARSSGLMQGIARGSAGGSLLSYYLKITHINPIALNLPFERFLSHARIRAGSFPDIDLDIADRARALVMKYLQEKYGLGFAQIATFSKMKAKKAITDSMYALYGRNRNDPEVRIVCNSIPDSVQGIDEWDFLYGYTDQEGEEHKGQVETNELLGNFFKQRPEIEEMVKRLIGLIKGWSRHPSAFVISTLDLANGRVPTMLMHDKELGEILVTQFDAPLVEKSNLVKADILGVKTLTMASDCIKLIKQNHNIDFMAEKQGVPLIYRLPDADEGVFADFYKKDTDSSFQFNTSLIKGFAQEFAPLNRADLAAMTALCRPGALDASLYDTTAAKYYMDIRNGKREVEYLHPDLESILKDSNGVFVYQEEVMKFLVDIVGYSWEESDVIRSAIAKKKHEVIMACFTKIREALGVRGWTSEAIESICHQIQAFSRYSFNKSHSCAYGELGYITLYLKHHFPLEWWCSVLNSEDKADKIRPFIVKLADKIAAPCIKEPSEFWAIRNGKLIAPISAIKGIGPAVVTELVSKGPFVDLEDYVAKVNHSKVNIGAMAAFIKARAADSLMDESIDDYLVRRKHFMDKYKTLRKTKTSFKQELIDADYLTLFLDERDTNTSFNKSLLSSPELVDIIMSRWPSLRKTGRSSIPLIMGGRTNIQDAIYILPDIKAAETLVLNSAGDGKKFGMICLFQESSFSQGISKKTGKPWKKLSVHVSDGYNIMECIWWDKLKPLRYKKNSIIYIYGEITSGWKTSIQMKVDEIEQVE